MMKKKTNTHTKQGVGIESVREYVGFPKATARFNVSQGLTELRELLYSQLWFIYGLYSARIQIKISKRKRCIGQSSEGTRSKLPVVLPGGGSHDSAEFSICHVSNWEAHQSLGDLGNMQGLSSTGLVSQLFTSQREVEEFSNRDFPPNLFLKCNSVYISWLPFLSVLTCFISYFKTLISTSVCQGTSTPACMCVYYILVQGTSIISTCFPRATLTHAHSIKLMPRSQWTYFLVTIFLFAMCGLIYVS